MNKKCEHQFTKIRPDEKLVPEEKTCTKCGISIEDYEKENHDDMLSMLDEVMKIQDEKDK